MEAKLRRRAVVRGQKAVSLFEATNKEADRFSPESQASFATHQYWKSDSVPQVSLLRPGILLGKANLIPSPRLRHGLLVDDHPRRAEPVSQHAEPESKEGFLHRHEDLAALREQGMNPLCLLRTIDRK